MSLCAVTNLQLMCVCVSYHNHSFLLYLGLHDPTVKWFYFFPLIVIYQYCTAREQHQSLEQMSKNFIYVELTKTSGDHVNYEFCLCGEKGVVSF